MLTTVEKVLFLFAVTASIFAAYKVSRQIVEVISRGSGKPDVNNVRERLVKNLVRTVTLKPTFKIRILPSLFHSFIAWGFLFYLLVNLDDIQKAFFHQLRILNQDTLAGRIYHSLADVISIAVLTGMTFMLLRRFVLKDRNLTTRPDIFLHPAARTGILRDSAIVGIFILFHVGSRWIGQSFTIALQGTADHWQPFATLVSNLWIGWSPLALKIGEHVCFWFAFGSILLFIPYFLVSKHLHLICAPLNLILKPKHRSIGELNSLNFDDESVEQFGVSRLEQLGWEQLLDAYACIMCYRCQEVCPAYNTGKVLSPATLEINKRYFLNSEGAKIARGEQSSQSLIEFAISPEAVWACTACGACVEICPVSNEPMRDILDIRRFQVLMENDFPDQLQTAFRGMERNANPWNLAQVERMKWAEGLNVATIEQRPKPEILWWVGCAPATDEHAKKAARAFAKILNTTGIDYAVLGKYEQCSGDSARRSGNEFLFSELASANIVQLNQIAPKRIVTTCPHCLHTLKNEYPAFGGNYQVVHHSQLITELISSGRLKLKKSFQAKITFHDPCYLGRHNHIFEAPREVLNDSGAKLVEMPRHARNSFCCGAGGAQMWKEEEHGSERVNANRFREAQQTGASILAVGCPFCMLMFTDAGKQVNSEMEVQDLAEIVVELIE